MKEGRAGQRQREEAGAEDQGKRIDSFKSLIVRTGERPHIGLYMLFTGYSGGKGCQPPGVSDPGAVAGAAYSARHKYLAW
jgi:hypothetical protein